MSDLTHIVNLHNEGSEWNAHEKRSIEASYIMKKFRELDDDKTLKLLFKKLYASGNYEIGKKGISLICFYWLFVRHFNSNQLIC